MAVRRRFLEAGLMHHSDRGSTYASEDYRKARAEMGTTCSMSRRENCYDHAAVGSWFSTMKHELGEYFESYAGAKRRLFDYIELFYNHTRRHPTLGHVSPAQHEGAAGMQPAAQANCPRDRIKPNPVARSTPRRNETVHDNDNKDCYHSHFCCACGSFGLSRDLPHQAIDKLHA